MTFRDPADNGTLATRTADCDVDQRTTVSFTCDPETRSYVASATGVNGQAGAANGGGKAYTVSYRYTSTDQPTQNDPGFTGGSLGGWDYTHRITRAADGSWSDVGFTHSGLVGQPAPWYSSQALIMAVFDQQGTQVGAGTATCVMFRNGQPVGY